MMKSVLLLAIVAVVNSPLVFSASFDCAKASTYAEKEVCSDVLLSNLDDALASNYQSMLGADIGGSVKSLKAEQRAWLVERDKCTSRDCLVASYKKRVNETCDYGVVSGVHPVCVMADEVE
ncbi:lysozyme inhibitor LprI family protein [Metapseudomonas otitidis]|uniref:lysozyme inhibitor LprI family protein n=1 Tax=Metapseudomonas otitidis TaxID=319939 RepID=UPI003EE3FAA2